MKVFYDRMLPSYAKEFGKKFGAKPGEAEIATEGGKPTNYADFDAYVAAKKAPVSVHSLDITPQMRQAALGEGFPLFQAREQGGRTAMTEEIRVLESRLERRLRSDDAETRGQGHGRFPRIHRHPHTL